MRTHLAAASKDYLPTDAFPRHPSTGKGWKHRNLRCTNCPDPQFCGCCGRACCQYSSAFYRLNDPYSSEKGKEESIKIMAAIAKIYPSGKEAPTFLQCTHDTPGEAGRGCGKMVCPECMGICPDPSCQDMQCRKCKRPDPWSPCDWHTGL